MTGFAEPWIPGFDPSTGALVVPLWSAVVVAAVLAACCVVILRLAGRGGMVAALPRVGFLLGGAAVAWIVLNAASAGSFAAQRRALDARLLELTTRAVMPGSALACLDAGAGELVEESCEKALFASPEATAASVAYVTAQLALLADGSAYERRSGADYEAALGGLRHAIETDRFGIVAHVLADREGCTAVRCGGFGLLRDARQVSANLTQHTYDAYVTHHASEWLQSALSLMAANAPSASPTSAPSASPTPSPVPSRALAASPPSAAAGKPNSLYFPSSASIPPVSIMSAEPTGPAPSGFVPPDASSKPSSPTARKPAAPSTPPQQQVRRPANPSPTGRPATEPTGDP
jgi:hypothetical protein